MNLLERLNQEIKTAMLARENERLGTLRLLKSAINYSQIEKKTDELSDAEIISVVQREIKKRRDAAEQYEKGARPELAVKEKKEMVILESFLPKPLELAELENLVCLTIEELGATSKKEMGPVIKAVQEKAAGRADGRAISSVVSKLLP